MDRYSLDPRMISLERFYALTRSKRMIPSRIVLQERIHEWFHALESHGIENLGQLISSLGTKEKLGAMATSTGIPEQTLVLLKREAGSYLAKPFPLSDLPGIPFEYAEVLRTRGIRNTRDFFERVQTGPQKKEVSLVTGIPESRIQEIFCLCDLTRITGVGQLYSRIIYDSGIRSTHEFANTDARTHLQKYREIIEKYGYQVETLGEDDMQYCIDYAHVILEMNP